MGAQLGANSFNDLNLTPLIDIVLVVLIIMMVNMPIEIEEMGIRLPSDQPAPEQATENPEQLVIAIYDNGDLALNRRLMTEKVLFYEVTRRLRPMRNKNVFIDGAPTVEYGRVVDMMDLAREAGAAKVGWAKLKESGPAQANSVAPGAMPRGVMVGSPITVGAMTEKQADKALKPYVKRIEACYFPLLSQHRDLSGRMMLRFSVGPQGEQMDRKISSSSMEPKVEQLEECVLELLPQVKFEPLGDNKTAIVQYPVLFSPG